MSLALRHVVRVASLGALIATALLAIPAGAGAAAWADVTGNTNTSNTQVQAARAANGVLHTVWVAPSAADANKSALYERDVLVNGTLGPVRTLLDGQPGLTNPAIAINPVDGKVWVYGAGAATLGGGLFAITSTDGFATWSAPASISGYGYAYSAFGLGAVFSASGAAYETFGRTVKLGNELTSAEDDFGTAPGLSAGIDGGCCTYWSQPAVDGVSGAASVAWYANITNRTGLEVIDLSSGATSYAPGSADANRNGSANGDMQTPLTGRIGAAGIYLGYCGGYPTCTSARVWRVGAAAATTVGSGSSLRYVRIAPSTGGRLWAFWISKRTLVARRSNAALTSWGAPVTLAIPGASDDAIWRTGGDGSKGWLDVLVAGEVGSGQATRTARLRPGLTLLGLGSATVGSKLTFTVVDAGTPVPFAKVKLGTKVYTANVLGKVTVTLPIVPGARAITASAGGYAPALRLVVAKRKR